MKEYSERRLRKQAIVFQYMKNKINNGESFIINDISKDLKMSYSTTREIIRELWEQHYIIYEGTGYIEIPGFGNNNREQRMHDLERHKKRDLRRVREQKLYSYLCGLANANKPLPSLSEIMKKPQFKNTIHISTMSNMLTSLANQKKIVYKKGKVVGVYVRNREELKGSETMDEKHTNWYEDKCSHNETAQPVEHHIEAFNPSLELKIEETPSIMITDTERYDKAVKDLIAEYITNADITTRDEILSYVDAIMKITDKLRDKLWKN